MKRLTYDVEEHTGGRGGIGQGISTGTYARRAEAVRAMAQAVGRGNGATCIARDSTGRGTMMVLGLINLMR